MPTSPLGALAVVPSHPSAEIYEEIARALTAELTAAGHAAFVARGPDRSYRQASALILVGDVARVALAAQHAERTNTPCILWQIEKLLEPSVFVELENAPIRSKDRLALALEKRIGPIARRVLPLGLRARGRAVTDNFVARSSSGDVLPRTQALQIYRLDSIREGNRVGWLKHVLVTVPSQVPYLQGLGVRASYLPVGSHPILGEDMGVKRDIDVSFLGYPRPDRREPLEKLRAELNDLTFVVDTGPTFGEARKTLYNRSKISLTIQPDVAVPSRFRLVTMMSCGAVVVTTPIEDCTPFEEGTHFVASTVANMAGTIRDLLGNERRLTSIAREAKVLVADQLSMTSVAERIGEIIHEDSLLRSRLDA